MAELEGVDAVPRGRVRLTTVPSLVEVIAPGLGRLATACPELEITLDATPLARDLVEGEADIALRPTADPPPALWGKRLSGIHWARYAACGLDPAGLPAIRYSVDGLAPDAGDTTTPRLARPWLRVTTVAAMEAAIVSGLGVGWLPLYVGDRVPRLYRAGAAVESRHGLYLLVPIELRKSARVRAVLERLIDALDPELAIFER